MILELQQALKDDGVMVGLVKVCRLFSVPRRTVYYKSTKGEPKVQEQFVKPIKAMIEENPSFGYRTVAHLLDMNKNTVQRVFQIMGGKCVNGLWGFAPGFMPCPRWLLRRMNDGPPICSESGVGATTGPRWLL